MTVIDASRLTITGGGISVVDTGAADDQSLAFDVEQRERNRTGWQQIIDGKLIEWGRDPSQLDDEDVTPPSGTAISNACGLATCGMDNDVSPPHRVVPNGDGGIVFERWDGPTFATIEIFEDGSIELCHFDDGKLVSRKRIV